MPTRSRRWTTHRCAGEQRRNLWPQGINGRSPHGTEWEHAVRVNLLWLRSCAAGPSLPHFRANGYGKIIQLSGGGATAPLPRLSAYAASKAAVVRFAETLAEELRGSGVDVNAIAPGALQHPRLLDEVLDARARACGWGRSSRGRSNNARAAAPSTRGRRATSLSSSRQARATVSPGKLISAPWDSWAEFPEQKHDLESSDVYTLRRIVPADRDLGWE